MKRSDIALGLVGGALACLALAFPASSALGGLWAARQLRSELTARIAAPPEPVQPIVASGHAIRAKDRTAAARALAEHIQRSAASAGLLVEMLAHTPPQPGVVTLRLRLSGPEKAMIAVIDGSERGTPLTRFRQWRATALADGGVRVDGELVAAWE